MPMTVIVTTNVAPRIRGFLASCVYEIGPGIYTSPNLTKGVRERIWRVCNDWFVEIHGMESSIIMTWRDKNEPGGQGIRSIGAPQRVIIDHEGYLLTKHNT
ncbi:MAG: type I-E CRISPR-associated endoribonuclease Cas2 [Candidatus Aegiribacteria sp.]|nr:type I-E CRISPR-associated endoribonuclease Cas2 [Candidatus Aegiribacteria sp.]